MRKMILLLLAICMTACLMACGSEAEQTRAEGEATEAVAEESEDAGEMTAEELQAAIEALEEDDEEETTGKYRVFDDYKDGELISNMAFTYNGQTVTAPYTVGDLIDMGLVYNSELRETEMVEPGELNKSYTDLYTANENWVHISACNTTDSPILLSECYVTEISANNNEVTMNGVTPGVSTYEDVLELLGKDSVNLGDTFDKDAPGAARLSYSAPGTKEDVGNRNLDKISFEFDVEDTGIIGEMQMYWYDF